MHMGSQIDKLLEKYWKGETSLEEEQIIKAHFKSAPSSSRRWDVFPLLI